MFIVFSCVMRNSHSVQINLLRLIVLFLPFAFINSFFTFDHICFIGFRSGHIDTETYCKELEKQVDLRGNTGKPFADVLFQMIIDALNAYVLNLAEKQIR